MSTVLDADRELRRRNAPAQSPDVAPMDRGPGFSWLRPLLIVVALAAGGTATVLFLTTRDTWVIPMQPAREAEAPATSEQLTRVPPIAVERGEREAPWGRVEKGSGAPPPAARPMPPSAARPLAPPAARPAPPPAHVAAKPPAARREEPAVARARPEPRARAGKPARPVREPAVVPEESLVPDAAGATGSTAATPEQAAKPSDSVPFEPVAPEKPAVANEVPVPVAREVPAVLDQETVRGEAPAREPVVSHAPKVAEEPPAPAPKLPREAPAAGMSGGTPRVRVSSISYAKRINDRSATVRINGGPAVTLREGESESGVEVQLILEDAVYLRHGGNVFAVGVSR